MSWITSGFLIVGSAVSPLFGKLGDSYGKKRMFLIALVFYIAAWDWLASRHSIYFLIFARAVQGIGFAIVPLALAIVAEVFPNERIATAQGVISATFAIGAAIGLVVGAYIVQDLGWQWAFHSAFIVSVIFFVIAAKVLPKGSAGTRLKVDYSTVVMLMAGVSLVLLYLTEGPTPGGLRPTNSLPDCGHRPDSRILHSREQANQSVDSAEPAQDPQRARRQRRRDNLWECRCSCSSSP